MTSPAHLSLAAFEAFIRRPENAEKRFELMNGEILDVPSNPFVSVIASRIIAFLTLHLMQNQQTGYVTGEGGGYVIDGHVFTPDVAVVRDLPTNEGFEPTPPVLVVEVLSDPSNSTEQTDLRRKLVHYLRAGVTVWVVDYVTRTVEVHAPGADVRVLNADGTLDGGELVRGFTRPVADIFPA